MNVGVSCCSFGGVSSDNGLRKSEALLLSSFVCVSGILNFGKYTR